MSSWGQRLTNRSPKPTLIRIQASYAGGADGAGQHNFMATSDPMTSMISNGISTAKCKKEQEGRPNHAWTR